jgi:hypothetical protein
MTVCPRCSSTECFAAPWQSDAEKHEHRGKRPYRCKSCLHRFYLAGGLRRLKDNPVVATVGGSTFFMVLAVIVIMWFWSGREMTGPIGTASPPHASPNPASMQAGADQR